MTDDEITAAVDVAWELASDSPALNPGMASRQNSIDFLDGLIAECNALRGCIVAEMGDE